MSFHQTFEELAHRARLRLLKMHYESGVGHIGGNLSAIDALLFLHHHVQRDDDLVVLSKGHAAGALYVSLWTLGRLEDADLDTFHGDGTLLAGHPVPGWHDGIPVATGSLGHGLPMATGMALAKRFRGERGRVYCLTSDGEWQCGSNWEAVIFAHHHRLDDLTILVDCNGLQGFGTIREVASMDPMRSRFEGFGLSVEEVDGHDPESLSSALTPGARVGGTSAGPRVVLLETIKGKGVSFMEDRLEWHYLPLTDAQYEQAKQELETRRDRRGSNGVPR